MYKRWGLRGRVVDTSHRRENREIIISHTDGEWGTVITSHIGGERRQLAPCTQEEVIPIYRRNTVMQAEMGGSYYQSHKRRKETVIASHVGDEGQLSPVM